uniref:Uncharacterized protein n=1 Tax=Arundo donax TaxID=35708 RepID=A0A0A8Y4S9_ARUDO
MNEHTPMIAVDAGIQEFYVLSLDLPAMLQVTLQRKHTSAGCRHGDSCNQISR